MIQGNRGRFFLGRSETTLLRGCPQFDRLTVRMDDCTDIGVRSGMKAVETTD